ncbi:MAG: efflux RND transporter permease subunit, partial [Desulfohalobiaceae bacterium]|nr:efflux RND transporter permease subunit [Desulfohalobiaceae bacterium]
IMSCLPFGLIGAVFGHLLLGYGLSVMSLFGMVALCGVVINDSLVLVDFANRNRREGKDPLEAVQTAATQRFRPIILTTLTTFGGLAPMIFETSLQARFLIPMALSLGFGLVFGTVVILILVPCIFLLLEDLRRGVLHFID